MNLLNKIGSLIINIMASCVGLWCLYVIVMALLNTFGLLNL
jgi:hypothetical protein